MDNGGRTPLDQSSLDTLAVHAGRLVMPVNAASSPPLFAASSYAFRDLDEMEAIYASERDGAIYGRYGGPNARHFASAMAEMENAEAAVATASGMAAIDAALRPHLAPGERLVVSTEVYGGSYDLFENDYRKDGIEVTFVAQGDLAALAAALAAGSTRVVHVETVTNPLTSVTDLAATARLAHDAGALLCVDATFTTPVLGRPIELGADLVIHSVGKYLGGHADVGCGVVSGRRELIARSEAHVIRRGAPIAHFDAWLALRGLRTLALRMVRHSANAAAVARFLAGRPEVAAVFHPSLPGHAQHALAQRLYPRGTGGILAFDLRGGRAAVDRFARALKRIAIVHSLGEVATTVSYSMRSSHRALSQAQRDALGVGEGVLRLSCGIEDERDIIADLAQALEAAGSGVPVADTATR